MAVRWLLKWWFFYARARVIGITTAATATAQEANDAGADNGGASAGVMPDEDDDEDLVLQVRHSGISLLYTALLLHRCYICVRRLQRQPSTASAVHSVCFQ